jgi:hypothetical protein
MWVSLKKHEINFFCILKSTKKGVGSGVQSGAISQRYGSGDPDLKHCLKVINTVSELFSLSLSGYYAYLCRYANNGRDTKNDVDTSSSKDISSRNSGNNSDVSHSRDSWDNSSIRDASNSRDHYNSWDPRKANGVTDAT